MAPYNHRMWDLETGKTSHEHPVLARGVGGMWVSPAVTISVTQAAFEVFFFEVVLQRSDCCLFPSFHPCFRSISSTRPFWMLL